MASSTLEREGAGNSSVFLWPGVSRDAGRETAAPEELLILAHGAFEDDYDAAGSERVAG